MLLAGLFALTLLAAPVSTCPPARVVDDSFLPWRLSLIAERIQAYGIGVACDASGLPVTAFGLPAQEARLLLIPVTRERALPEGYAPPDLRRTGGRLVRSLVLPDLTAMIEAAGAEGIELVPISGYRSPGEQELAFQSAVWRSLARAQGPTTREEAEARAARFVAPPGHSQHQLGTAVDFSSWEVNYGLQARFAETESGQWLQAHAWQYGFVLSYPKFGEERSGYAYEPWHYRWIGRELAAMLQSERYLEQETLIVDDYLRAAEEVMLLGDVR